MHESRAPRSLSGVSVGVVLLVFACCGVSCVSSGESVSESIATELQMQALGTDSRPANEEFFAVGCACRAFVTERTCQPTDAGVQYFQAGAGSLAAVLRKELRPSLGIDVTGLTQDGTSLAVEFTPRFGNLPPEVRSCLEQPRTAWFRYQGNNWILVTGSDRRK
ncbi:MAG: hypothetical protein Q7V01_07180 [Vicinamibacterales bacterium]|nr:hypothetical protein [Vicinamibacterales bacterium]